MGIAGPVESAFYKYVGMSPPAPQGSTSRGFNINADLTNIAVQKWCLKVPLKSSVQIDIKKLRPKVAFKRVSKSDV